MSKMGMEEYGILLAATMKAPRRQRDMLVRALIEQAKVEDETKAAKLEVKQ